MRKQIALCIGNNNYQFDCLNKLDCAINDCLAISEKLTNLNFDVFCYENADRMDKVFINAVHQRSCPVLRGALHRKLFFEGYR